MKAMSALRKHYRIKNGSILDRVVKIALRWLTTRENRGDIPQNIVGHGRLLVSITRIKTPKAGSGQSKTEAVWDLLSSKRTGFTVVRCTTASWQVSVNS